MPPCAATYWSCLPTGSLRMSISISHAASASSRGGSVVRRASASAFSRQTVYAPEEPMPGARGHVGHRGDLQRLAAPVADQRLAQDRVADLARVVDLLELRVLQPVAALEDRVREHVDVLVDRPADQEAAVLAVVGGQVGAAAAERDAQRRAAEDDAHRPPGRSGMRLEPLERLDRRPRGCSTSAPSRARGSCAESRWISGLSPAQPRVAAGVLELRLDAEVAAITRDRVVDDDRLVGAEVVDGEARLPRARPARSGSRSRSPARRGSSSAGGRRRARAAASGRRAARGRSRTRGRACSARRGSRRSGRRPR